MLGDRRKALPVLKVLYRNSQQIQIAGSESKAALEAIHAAEHASEGDIGAQIRDACPQHGRRAGRKAAGRRREHTARCVQRPATSHSGRRQRPPLCFRPSNLWASGIARRGVFVLDASPVRPALRRSRTRAHLSQSSRASHSHAGPQTFSTSTSWTDCRRVSAIRAMRPSMTFAWQSTTARATKRPEAVAAGASRRD